MKIKNQNRIPSKCVLLSSDRSLWDIDGCRSSQAHSKSPLSFCGQLYHIIPMQKGIGYIGRWTGDMKR